MIKKECCLNCEYYKRKEAIECVVLHKKHPEDTELSIGSPYSLRCEGYIKGTVKDDNKDAEQTSTTK